MRDVLLGAGWTREAPTSGGASRDRWQSLDALAELADQTAARDPEARMPVFVAELEQRAAEQNAPTVQGVTLASLHAAKGLEWDAVFLVGCSDGLLPISMADTPEAVEEERRLLYVGVTRARERLTLSYAAARTPGAKATRRPSRFLDGTAALLGEAARSQPRRRAAGASGKARATRVRSTCRACGAALGTARERTIGRCSTCPATVDERLFEALREWRLETAREADVPAFVVFTDATLIAIAETAPADVAGLARINGVGPAKLERYGAEVLGLLSRFSDSENS